MEEMLQLAKEKDVKLWVEKRLTKEINQAIVDTVPGKPRYEYVLKN